MEKELTLLLGLPQTACGFRRDLPHPPSNYIQRSVENNFQLDQTLILEQQHAEEDVEAGDDLEVEPVGEFQRVHGRHRGPLIDVRQPVFFAWTKVVDVIRWDS